MFRGRATGHTRPPDITHSFNIRCSSRCKYPRAWQISGALQRGRIVNKLQTCHINCWYQIIMGERCQNSIAISGIAEFAIDVQRWNITPDVLQQQQFEHIIEAL